MASLCIREGNQEILLFDSIDDDHRRGPVQALCLNKSSGFSIKYACNGHESYWIEGKKLHLAPGEALFINHKLCFTNRFQADRLSHGFCVYYSEQEMATLCTSLCNAGSLTFDSLKGLPELKIPRNSDLSLSMASLYRNYRKHKSEMRNDLMHLLWIDFFKTVQPKTVLHAQRLGDLAPSTRHSLMRKLKMADIFMVDKLSKPILLEDIANHVGMSPFHFQRQYKKANGQSPSRKLVLLRMEKAKELILAGNLQILEIATFLAYNDLPTFSKAFKREFGLSPVRWKKKN